MSTGEYAKKLCPTQKALTEKMLENEYHKFDLVVIYDMPVMFTYKRLKRNLRIVGKCKRAAEGCSVQMMTVDEHKTLPGFYVGVTKTGCYQMRTNL